MSIAMGAIGDSAKSTGSQRTEGMCSVTTAKQSATTSRIGKKAWLNQLYAEWLGSDGRNKEDVAVRLNQALMQYAGAVLWMKMRTDNPHLKQEMVNDLWMSIGSFRGDSSFSTWVFSLFRNRCVLEWRYMNKSLGQSLESLQRAAQERSTHLKDPADPDSKIYVEEYLDNLEDIDREIVQLRMDGLTTRQIAETTGKLGRSSVQRHIAALPEVEL
jgi:RNA polymerase sigma factor (sigma-70 family)